MTIQKKLSLALGAMAVMTLLLGAISAEYVRRLSTATDNILADNYKSLEYANDMMGAMDSPGPDMLAALGRSLELQKKNVTEASEAAATEALTVKIADLEKSPGDPAKIAAVKGDLYRIIDLNMAAISNKSAFATSTAHRALVAIVILAALCVAAAVIVFLALPKSLLKPLSELKRGISEVSELNWRKKLDLGDNEEFGEIEESFNRMAEKIAEYRRSTIEDLMISKKRIEAIVNSLHEPVIGLGADKTLLFLNDKAAAVLNISKEDAVGKNAAEIALSNDLMRRLVRGVSEGADSPSEPMQIYADDKESYFQMENIPLNVDLDGSGRKSFIGNVIILNNITKFRELDKAKTNFISTISHEMKTPIASIIMSLKLLEDGRNGGLSPAQEELAQAIRENSDRLLNMTGELLKMTQLETGNLKIMPKLTRPIELINYAVSATKILAERFGCYVEVEYPEKIRDLFVDSEKIAWVITNLLSNAIHHSAEGARIIVGARENGKDIEMYVRDFGRGIDPRYHKSIFDRYFRVPGTKVQGSGLGLAISKDFLEAHNGKICVESEVGKGSTFIVTLPSV